MSTALHHYWDNVYETKSPSEVSWTQETPDTSLRLVRQLGLPTSAPIIDVGGGESRLVDHLLEEGYEDISVLDISSKALEKSKQRLGKNADKVNWINSDILSFVPDKQYAIWHDRATFHFLTQPNDINHYLDLVRQSVAGYLVLGTFSDSGPLKCSGLPVQQYDEHSLYNLLVNDFEKIGCFTEDHITPFSTRQNFLFCTFRRRAG